ncbi:MAG: lysophospholipid acyltransferase family protein [Thermovirgaceae bacterium]
MRKNGKENTSCECVWRAILLFRWILWHLPHRAAVTAGKCVGWAVWALSKKRVDRAERRCVHVLGVGITKARRIVRDSYLNLGRSLAEFLRLPLLGPSVDAYVEVHGEENLQRALAEGHGVILLTAHLGNWELAAAVLGRKGYPMNAIGAEQRDPRITNLIELLRASSLVKTIGKGFDLKAALKCLRKGEILGVLLDQDFGDRGIVVPFLGVEASTPYGPLKMADKISSRIVPLFIVRRPDGIRHDLHLLPALEPPSGEDFATELEASVRLCNDVIGEWIMKYPHQWMWLYPRWASTTGDR